MALTATDRLLGGYLGFVTIVMFARGAFPSVGAWGILAFHALFGVLLWLFTRLKPGDRLGIFLHTLYPLIMLIPLYGEFGLINDNIPVDRILAHDAVVQQWEAALFGGQASYEWIRRFPSVFWSGVLHLAYLAYYVIIAVGPLWLVIRGRPAGAQHAIFCMMLAYMPCYVLFLVYPVAGPYYAFEGPTGPVREVWSAQLVYGLQAEGSSIGAAFPSSHVAATVSANLALVRYAPWVAAILAPLTILLVVGTVYTQQHYAVDVLVGLVVALAALWLGPAVAARLSRGGVPRR